MADQPIEYGWVIIELMGRTKVAGYLTEDSLGLRLQVPATPGYEPQTSWYMRPAIYAIHAVTEDVVMAAVARWRPEPVHRWELPVADPEKTPRMLESDYDEDDDSDLWMATTREDTT